MSASQRNKGATYEREVCAVFSQKLGTTFKRNIDQAREGGNDINVGSLKIECKRRKSLKTLEAFINQAKMACAGDTALLPTVVMRSDGGQSMVLISLDHFLTLAGPVLRNQIALQRDRADYLAEAAREAEQLFVDNAQPEGNDYDFGALEP